MSAADGEARRWGRVQSALERGQTGVLSDAIASCKKRSAHGLLEHLLDTLAQNDRTVKAMSACALGMLGDPRAIGPLILLLTSDQDDAVRARAAESLGVLGADSAIPLLEAAFSSGGPDLRHSAMHALKRLGSTPLATLQRNLASQEPAMRAETAIALGESGDVRTLPLLLAALEDPDSTVRRHAACALGQFRDPIAVELLICRLTDPGMEVAWCAIHSLGAIDDKRAVEPVAALLTSHPDIYTRQEAAVVLGRLGDQRGVPALFRALHDPDMYVRRAASCALAQLGIAPPAPVE